MNDSGDETSGGDRLAGAHGGDTAAVDRPAVTAAPPARHWLVFVGLAVAVVLVDQLSKAWLTATLAPGERLQVIGDLLRLVHGRNSGGLFGLFSGSAEIFAIASVGVIALIVLYHARSRPAMLLSLALGLLLGGAIGNLLDRIRLGYVVDFVDAGIGDVRFYTFNVADSAITGAILLLLLLALVPRLAGEPDGGRDA